MMPKMKRSPPPPVVSTSSARWPTDSSRHHSPRPTVSGGQRQRDKLRLVAHLGERDDEQRTEEGDHDATARRSAQQGTQGPIRVSGDGRSPAGTVEHPLTALQTVDGGA